MSDTGMASDVGNPIPEEDIEEKRIPRTAPEVDETRKQFVSKITKEIKADKDHWKPAFKRMREDQDFARGLQWSTNEDDDRYVANITLRHVNQRVAALYAKNPRTVARLKPRLMTTVWDENMSTVMASLQIVQMSQMNPMMQGSPEFAEAVAVLQDAKQFEERRKLLKKFARTLELFYEYQLNEQAHPFKTMMKLVVRRAVTSGVGYVKLGFQRIMENRPDAEAAINDATQRLATLERLATDLADQELSETDAEIERLRFLLRSLETEREVIVREGLALDYPNSTAIIPHRNCVQLREFLGCDWVTEEHVLTPERVQEIYGIDVRPQFQKYATEDDGNVVATGGPDDEGVFSSDEDAGDQDRALCVVWEHYNKADGLVYIVCDGYPDFLREPAPPSVWTERFWPWYPLVLNEVDHPTEIFPLSDVAILRPAQKEYNRLREGLREHRKQNRPTTVAASGILSDEDKEVLRQRPAAALIELAGLSPGQKVDDVLQPLRLSGVDPNLYEVNSIFEDVLRSVGVQEANLGGATGNTATESSIAESSRMSSLQANIDELDDLLSLLARAAGQILMDNVSVETVKQTLGPGAVWPELSREDLAREVFLEIETGSTGRPNQVQEVQNFERLAPLLMQIPGMKPEPLAKEGIRRMDDRLDPVDFYDSNLPSITALNQMMGTPPGGPQQTAGPNAPAAQGPQGAGNAPGPQRPAGTPGGPDRPAPERQVRPSPPRRVS